MGRGICTLSLVSVMYGECSKIAKPNTVLDLDEGGGRTVNENGDRQKTHTTNYWVFPALVVAVRLD